MTAFYVYRFAFIVRENVILNGSEESVNQGKRVEHSLRYFPNLADSSLSLRMTLF
jgi:hypothetical protein